MSVDHNLANWLETKEGRYIVANDGGEIFRVAVCPSDSLHSAIQNAILFLYCMSGAEMITKIKEGLSLYYIGSKCKGRRIKQMIKRDISEGKKLK